MQVKITQQEIDIALKYIESLKQTFKLFEGQRDKYQKIVHIERVLKGLL